MALFIEFQIKEVEYSSKGPGFESRHLVNTFNVKTRSATISLREDQREYRQRYSIYLKNRFKIWDFLRFNVRNRGEINFKIIEQIILLLIIVRTLNINSFLASKT